MRNKVESHVSGEWGSLLSKTLLTFTWDPVKEGLKHAYVIGYCTEIILQCTIAEVKTGTFN